MRIKSRLAQIKRTIFLSEKNPRNIFCLGCAVKVPLKEILYPALRRVIKRISLRDYVTLKIGDEACIFESDRDIKLQRNIYPLESLKKRANTIRRNIKKFKPNNAVLLASYTDDVKKREITDSLISFCNIASATKIPFLIGKGHTIKIAKVPEQKFIMVDYLRSLPGKYYGVASNDTIVTLDFNLRHSHWLNLFISFNNALNDLFTLGVYKDIKIYPTYDSISEKDNQIIRNGFNKFLKEYNFPYDIIDRGPLGLNLEAIGATAVGITDREPPGNSGLLPGQLLIVTRPIGDLPVLVLYILKKSAGILTKDIRGLKFNVLNQMLIPNVKIAKVIHQYLPAKGEIFDPRKHITATKDLSGAGITGLEELSERSEVDIYIKRLQFHSNKITRLQVPNNTSNTNGPIVIAAQRNLTNKIISQLEKIGCSPWIAGEVGEKRRRPIIWLDSKLKRYEFMQRMSKKLFSRYRWTKKVQNK